MPEDLFEGPFRESNGLNQLSDQNKVMLDNNSTSTAKIQIELEVNRGIVELVKIQQQPYVGFLRPEVDASLASAIQGEYFGPHLPDVFRSRIKDTGIFEDCDEATQNFLADCVHKMIGNFA